MYSIYNIDIYININTIFTWKKMSIFIETQSSSVALTLSLHIKNIDSLFPSASQVWTFVGDNSQHLKPQIHVTGQINGALVTFKWKVRVPLLRDSKQPWVSSYSTNIPLKWNKRCGNSWWTRWWVIKLFTFSFFFFNLRLFRDFPLYPCQMSR